MNSDLMGYVAALGVMAVVAVIIVILRKKLGQTSKNYDERQILIRGKGYMISFMTVILLLFIYAGFFYGMSKDIVSPQLVIFAISFIGITVYVIYCILGDAYLQVGQNPKKWIFLMVLVIIVNVLSAFVGSDRGLTENGLATGMAINSIIAILFAVILVVFLIKLGMDKRGEGHEES